MSGSPEELAAEVERLRAERDALRGEVEGQRPRSRWRSVVSFVLVVAAIVTLAVATPAAWGRRTLFDTDRYVATVAPLAADPAVQDALARELTVAVFDAIGVEEKIATALHERLPRLEFIAGPIAQGLEGFVRDQVQVLFASDLFQRYWADANRLVHAQAIAALSGEGDVLATQDGKVVLNYLPLVNESLNAMSELIADLVGRPIDLPEVTPETVPAEAILAIEVATGVDLPETFGSVVLYESDAFATAQRAFDLANKAVYLLIVLLVATIVGALWLSARRRRTLLQLMTGFGVVLVLERRFAMAATDSIVGNAKEENQAAARAVLDAVLDSLLRYTGWLLLAVFLTALVALLTGPYPWAVRTRTVAADLGRGLTGMADADREGTAVAWVSAHRDPLMLAGAVLGAVLLLLADLSLGWMVVVLVLLGGFELLVWRAGSARETGAPEPGG